MTAGENPSRIRTHYDDEPYPPRDPNDEQHRLLWTTGGNLVSINHHCFHGSKTFNDGFRCLVAGGGSGDCLIFLAEQLRDCNAEIVYLDVSPASRDLARARAESRGLTNIEWVIAPLTEIPELGLGKFDFINCSGVLHHIRPPVAGLRVLADALTDDGAMYLMTYGKYGRRSVSDMQLMLRDILPEGANRAEKIRLARKLIDTLPENSVIGRDFERMRDDMKTDSRLYDLLLYDMSLYEWNVNFSIPEIRAMAEECGLSVLDFIGRSTKLNEIVIDDEEIRALLGSQDRLSRLAFAEKYDGTIRKHELFVGKPGTGAAMLNNDSNALLANGTLILNAPQIAATMPTGQVLKYKEGTREFSLMCDDVVKVVFAHLDGRTSLKNLYRKIVKQTQVNSIKEAQTAVARIYQQMHQGGYLYLAEVGAHGKKLPDQAALLGRT